jgi:hypothetical protein
MIVSNVNISISRSNRKRTFMLKINTGSHSSSIPSPVITYSVRIKPLYLTGFVNRHRICCHRPVIQFNPVMNSFCTSLMLLLWTYNTSFVINRHVFTYFYALSNVYYRKIELSHLQHHSTIMNSN